MRRLAFAALACLSLTACKEDAATTNPLAAFGQGVEWHVTEIDGKAVPEGVSVTMALVQEGLLGGNGGCTRYNGRISVVEGALHLGELAGTRMMCPDPQMRTEEDFHSALPRAKQTRVTASGLELSDASGKVLIRATK